MSLILSPCTRDPPLSPVGISSDRVWRSRRRPPDGGAFPIALPLPVDAVAPQRRPDVVQAQRGQAAGQAPARAGRRLGANAGRPPPRRSVARRPPRR